MSVVLVCLCLLLFWNCCGPADNPYDANSMAYAKLENIEHQREMVNDEAEFVSGSFEQTNKGVDALLLNWRHTGKACEPYGTPAIFFCGNITEIKQQINDAEWYLDFQNDHSSVARNSLSSSDRQTSKSIEALFLPTRYSNMLCGMRLSIEAIECTEVMLVMIDSGNASIDNISQIANLSYELHKEAGYAYSDAIGGASAHDMDIAFNMNRYSCCQLDNLEVLKKMLRSNDIPVIVDTNRTLWGFCNVDDLSRKSKSGGQYVTVVK